MGPRGFRAPSLSSVLTCVALRGSGWLLVEGLVIPLANDCGVLGCTGLGLT